MRRSIQLYSMQDQRTTFANLEVLYTVMTRFNLYWNFPGMKEHRKTDATYSKWLEARIGAFKAYCLPPMLQQSITPHAWFILFDRTITPEISTLLEELLEIDWVIPFFLGDNWRATIDNELRDTTTRKFAGRGFTHTCCIRLDSDDSLNCNFVAVIDEAIKQLRTEWDDSETQAINFPYGVLQIQDRYTINLQERQFFGIYESLAEMKTPYRTDHRKIHDQADVWDVFTPQPMFIRHAHDSNITNVADAKRKARQVFGDTSRLLEQFGLPVGADAS